MTTDTTRIYDTAYRLIRSMARESLLQGNTGDPMTDGLLDTEKQVRADASSAWHNLSVELKLDDRKAEISPTVNDAMIAALRDTREGLKDRHLVGLASFLEGFSVDSLFERVS